MSCVGQMFCDVKRKVNHADTLHASSQWNEQNTIFFAQTLVLSIVTMGILKFRFLILKFSAVYDPYT